MDEDIAIINSNTRNQKIRIFFKNNKKKNYYNFIVNRNFINRLFFLQRIYPKKKIRNFRSV